MANGDDAAAVGYDTVAGSEDIRQAYDEINVTRDYVARHRTNGTHRADQITSGVLPVERGGTGRPNLYGPAWSEQINSSTNAIVTVSSASVLRRATGRLGPGYLGFRLHFDVLFSLDFDSDGAIATEHGADFTPLVIFTQPLLAPTSVAVHVQPRPSSPGSPSWNSENVFLRALTEAGPYTGLVSALQILCFGAP